MLCCQATVGLGMPGICIHQHIAGNVFLLNVDERFYSCHVFAFLTFLKIRFNVFYMCDQTGRLNLSP